MKTKTTKTTKTKTTRRAVVSTTCAQCYRTRAERPSGDKLIEGLCGACREANAEMQADDAAVAAHRVAPAYTPKNSHDEENPAYLFSGTSTAILCGVLNGTIDPLRLVRVELANRGLNRAGVWVGFEQAKRLAEVGR